MKGLFSTMFAALLMVRASQAAAIETGPVPVSHGSYGTMEGRTWRYHQIYNGVWQGVLPDEWDDQVHVKNDDDLDMSNITALDPAGGYTLDDRDIRGICSNAVACTGIAAAANAAGASIKANWEQFLAKIVAAHANAPDIWGFLNKPFVATMIGPVPSWLGAITTLLLYVKPNAAPVASCSNQNTELDVINTAVQQGLAAIGPNTSNYIKVEIALPDGRQVSISVSSTPGPDQGGCGSPPTTGATPAGGG